MIISLAINIIISIKKWFIR